MRSAINTPLIIRSVLLVLIAFCQNSIQAQTLYSPPTRGNWEPVDPLSVGWDPAQLSAVLDIAGERDASGVVILYNGRIVAVLSGLNEDLSFDSSAGTKWYDNTPPLRLAQVRRAAKASLSSQHLPIW